MQKFSITPESRAAFRPIHRRVQAAIAVLASRTMGQETTKPEGIFKAEGGVVCNKREIAIMRDYVKDDWKPFSQEATPEETAVALAVEEVAKMIENGDDLSSFPHVSGMADPLYSLLY